ncbi:hypothetical protein D1BOALGB6SA_10405 [Olavius sp. associated proteobacterium Delta 1]|nr:hypothetical protein D1BOALGB6SA_10405 [Olavius sp. associated proteobacterium Delta 1]
MGVKFLYLLSESFMFLPVGSTISEKVMLNPPALDHFYGAQRSALL